MTRRAAGSFPKERQASEPSLEFGFDRHNLLIQKGSSKEGYLGTRLAIPRIADADVRTHRLRAAEEVNDMKVKSNVKAGGIDGSRW